MNDERLMSFKCKHCQNDMFIQSTIVDTVVSKDSVVKEMTRLVDFIADIKFDVRGQEYIAKRERLFEIIKEYFFDRIRLYCEDADNKLTFTMVSTDFKIWLTESVHNIFLKEEKVVFNKDILKEGLERLMGSYVAGQGWSKYRLCNIDEDDMLNDG